MSSCHKLALKDKLLSSLRERDATLAAIELVSRQPELIKNCPNTLYDFVRQIQSTLRIDNEPFDFDHGHEYLIDPYKSMEVVGNYNEEGAHRVLLCGAQVGKTVLAMLTAIFLACRFWGKYIGYFFPDRDMAMITSGVRFKPLAMSIPEIAPLWGEDPTKDDKTRKKSDAQRVRSIGPSQIFFGYMLGKTSTESIPLLGMMFDEVRRMLDSDIERARERMSHSPYPYEVDISTAGYPGVNIDRAFRRSNQHKFHSRCKCSDGVVLADVFPDCIGERLPGVTPGMAKLPQYFFVCPQCKEPIGDPRDGLWVPHNKGAFATGYHIPQILSPRQSAGKIYNAYLEATDMIEFYNSKLGIPHITAEAQIVNLDNLRATVDGNLRWPEMAQTERPRNCAMGIDQMMGFNVVVIRRLGEKMANGKRESILVHLEWVADPGNPLFDPWQRCGELMKLYDVGFCVADSMPNANEAMRFANAPEHKGRVFLADYSYEAQTGEDIAIWEDKVASDPNRKAAQEIKSKYRVRISRFHAIEWNLMRYVKRIKRQPHEKGLLGLVPNKRNQQEKVFIGELFWKHLMSVARRKLHVTEKITVGGTSHTIDQGKIKMIFENVGIDPHFLHADLYCELALTRIKEGDGAFGDFKAMANVSDMSHAWEQNINNPEHYQCTACGFQVAVPPGMTPGEMADKAGFAECASLK